MAEQFAWAAVLSTVFALTQSELWLLRTAVVLFVLMVTFCAIVWKQVRESSDIAQRANEKATDLDKRTAAIEEKLRPKE